MTLVRIGEWYAKLTDGELNEIVSKISTLY